MHLNFVIQIKYNFRKTHVQKPLVCTLKNTSKSCFGFSYNTHNFTRLFHQLQITAG